MGRALLLFMAALVPLCIHGQPVQRALALNEAIVIGLKKNPELRAADAGVAAASGRFRSGIALPPPEFSIAHEYVPKGMGLGQYTERTLGVSQSFEFPTNYFLKGSVLSSEEDVARSTARQEKLSMIARIKNAYFAAWAARLKLQYARDDMALSDSILEKVNTRTRVGEAPHLELLTARVQQSEAKHNVMAAGNEMVTAYADLNSALGFSTLEYDTSVVLTDSLVTTPPHGIDSLFIIVDERNPRLVAARARIRSASATRSLAWSTLLPGFTVSYFAQAKDGVDRYYGASLSVTIPLWFMLDTGGKVEESQAGLVQAEAELAATRTTLFAELRNAVSNLQNNVNSVRLYELDLIPQAEEIYRTATSGYAAGDLSYLEYLQGKVTLLATRRNYLSALLNYLHSATLLEELTGGPEGMHIDLETP